jgi:hypothetical protein
MESEAIAPAAVPHALPTQPAPQLEHVCSRLCSVTLLFGNVYKCSTSGQVHVCDQNCTQLMDWDREHYLCRVSKKMVKKAPCHQLTHSSSLERYDKHIRACYEASCRVFTLLLGNPFQAMQNGSTHMFPLQRGSPHCTRSALLPKA